MLVCVECGHLFDEEKIAVWQESRGEYWGVPCFESVGGCPICKGHFVDAHRCDCCGEWINSSYIKLENGKRICEDCYTEYEIGEE